MSTDVSLGFSGSEEINSDKCLRCFSLGFLSPGLLFPGRLNEMFLNSLYKHFYLDRAATIINVTIDESVDHFQMSCLDITDRYSCCCHPQNIHKS